MSDKATKNLTTGAGAPNKMRLYATWVDRTPSNCIPRLCTLTLTKLQILKPLGTDVISISIAVKIHSSKRTLRSNEINLPAINNNNSGVFNNTNISTGNNATVNHFQAPLDVTFCLQYPHYLKREGNKLHILLQRRKRYKNRTILGFKTLAEGVIRMDQVLQKPMDIELDLITHDNGGKDKTVNSPYARLNIMQLSSTPVDQQEHNIKTDREHDFSDDDDDISSQEEDVNDLSDSEPIRTKMPHAARHSNLKQRFVSLLRRFRVPDSEGGRAADLDNPSDIQALFHELESLSCDEDSGGEQDTMSISSTPKPSLRPFFSSSKSLLDSSAIPFIETEKIGDERTASGSDGNADLYFTDPEAQSDPQTGSPPREHQMAPSKKLTIDNEFGGSIMQEFTEKKSKLFRTSASLAKKKNSLSISSETAPIQEIIAPRKGFLDQISRLLSIEEMTLPDGIVLITGAEHQASIIATRLTSLRSHNFKVFQPVSAIEVKTVLTAFFAKIHKYCNTCAKPGTPLKILLIGNDALIGWFLRPYVEILSSKPSEWLAYTRIYVIPLSTSNNYCMGNVSRHLSALDPIYFSLFNNEIEPKAEEITQRVIRYVSVPISAPLAHFPIAEAMLTCYDETSQLFIPFISEVRVGPAETVLTASVDLDDICSSPSAPLPSSLTPPSSPNVQTRESPWEPIELQIDYWQIPKSGGENVIRAEKEKDKSKQDGKTSLKGVFRGLQAFPSNNLTGLNVNMHMANKEKKQKIMRLGKKKEKEKETESRSQTVEGVSRLICSARASHTIPMRVYIDGVEFSGVKFFQLSFTWQTHVKNLTVSLMGVPLASTEMN